MRLMNRITKLTLCRAYSIAIIIALAVFAMGMWPHSARADWQSLSGGLLPKFVDRVDYQISSDSRTVAFMADKETDDVNELYAVPITGTTPIKLNPALVAGGDVRAFQFTPDGQFVIYTADQEVSNRVELYRVPVGGGAAVKLNAALVSGGNVDQVGFKIDGKNGRVVYRADQQTNEVFELWSVPIAGGASVKLNGALVTGGNINAFQIDPLSNRVVYTAKQDSADKYELYSVPVAGGAFIKLNPPIVLTGGGDDGLCCEFAVDAVVPVVVFIAREAGSTGGKVYSIPTAGGPLTPLSFNLLATQRMLSFRISPGGDRVVFNVGTRSGSTNAVKGGLYSALIGGGGAADLTDPADPTFGVDLGDYQFTPDGKYVVYGYQKNAAAIKRLESSVTNTGVRATLYAPGTGDPPLSFYRFSPNSQWVMYQSGANFGSRGLNTVPPSGGNPTRHGNAEFQLITPDSNRIVYTRVVSPAINTTDLFSAQIFGGDERNLSGMNGAGYVSDVAVSKDGKWIVYLVQIDSQYDLRVSDGKAAQPPVTPTPITFYSRLPIVLKQH